MNYPSLRIEGAILSPDILDRLEELPGQKPQDFGLDSSAKVKDEIARAWADAQDYWRIFQRKLEAVKGESPATTETRQLWVGPLLGLLGYQLEYQARGTELHGKLYSISHRVANRANAPVQIVGYREPSGLDRKPQRANVRMSAHAVVQEFINLNDQLYGLVTNGRLLRLLRDSSRLIRLSYVEFDLDRMFGEALYADFAVMYRLLHASRLPPSHEAAAESWIERYHQDSLDSGARIREGLSRAVEQAIRNFGNGFLAHPANDELRAAVASGAITPADYYHYLLRLIYRLLFLMVIEERDLVFPAAAKSEQRELYRNYYSLQRLRGLAERRYLADHRRHDLWIGLLSTFRLFEADGPGPKLGLAPLAGDLFGTDAIGPLGNCRLGNDVLLGCLRALSLYTHPETAQIIRVNYGALNVEEFGSVYEGLLEYEPILVSEQGRPQFGFKAGDERSRTGSHYTPDDLVQPLIKHSLDHLIVERLKAVDPEAALLALRIADISCGSGHILLAAARRIATDLAIVRTGEEQPSPTAYRTALRDVIRNCVYGVDLNPLAVELCKVALWLEAHSPGQPLNFLDHHIKCGNSIVGFVRREEIEPSVPDEAFATRVGDEKEATAALRKKNKQERAARQQLSMALESDVKKQLDALRRRWHEITEMPERSPRDIEAKKLSYARLVADSEAARLCTLADIPISQFFVRKCSAEPHTAITSAEFESYWEGGRRPVGEGVAAAVQISRDRRFFHWFVEFPDVLEDGGFDCVLGNPPYLGSQSISGTFGHDFCAYVKWQYAPAGICDLVVYFLRRIFSLLKAGGSAGLITTNSIKDGDNRRDGLAQLLLQGGQINMAVRAIRWPGRANVVVSLLAIHKGHWQGSRYLDGRTVSVISEFLEDSLDAGEPQPLKANANRIYQGVIFLGDGFLLSHGEAASLIREDPRNAEVVYPVINGQEVNSLPTQEPGRHIVNFHTWDEARARSYPQVFALIEARVWPNRAESKSAASHEAWWRFLRPRAEMTEAIRPLSRCFVTARVTKHLCFSAMPTNFVFLNNLYVLATERWDLFAVVQSTLHESWARKHSMCLKQDLQYSPTDCFVNFAFPDGILSKPDERLAGLGERYHAHRKSLMLSLGLGLTDIYNLVHARELSPAEITQVSGKATTTAEQGCAGIVELRRLREELDLAVLAAYGWHALDLGYDFHEVDTLPESDRVRYTISPSARKEILRLLLKENQLRADEERRIGAANVPTVARARRGKAKADTGTSGALFD